MSDPALEGTVVGVAAKRRHDFSKESRASIRLISGQGVEGDAHAGALVRHRYLARRNPRAPNLRQVHLIPRELFDVVRPFGYDVYPGYLGENITTLGLDLEWLPLGTQLRFSSAASVELTGLRTPCVLIDQFKAGLKRRMLGDPAGPVYRAGVMAIVLHGGEVSAGDRICAVLPPLPRLPLPPL
jgi:MOSC domain-containing protein YiiM